MQSRQALPLLHYDTLFRLLGYKKEQEEILDVLHGFTMSTIKKRKEEFRKQRSLRKEEQEQVIGEH